MAAKGGKASKLAQTTFEASIKQLERYVEKQGVKETRAFLRETRSVLRSRLLAAGGKGSTTATALQFRAMLEQVEAILRRTNRQIEVMLEDTTKTAARMGARHAVDEFKALNKHFAGTTPVLGLDRAAVFRSLVDGVVASRLRAQTRSVQSWGLQTVNAVERYMSLATASGVPVQEMVRGVAGKTGVLSDELWKAERIVRTELAYAHGATKHQALVDTSDELGDDDPLMKRLIETFDDRTGDDSFLIHGQTVPVDKPFEYKRRKGSGWQLVRFMHPPNRPNDRSVVIPWRKSWDTDATIEKPLTVQQLRAARTTRYRKKPGVAVPPGHRPGQPYTFKV